MRLAGYEACRQSVLDATFARLETIAAAGRRCPPRSAFLHHDALSILAAQGRIRVEVWCHNWRVVEILTGPHTGARTQAAPLGREPYRVLGPRREPQAAYAGQE